jgi:hypothetical protein
VQRAAAGIAPNALEVAELAAHGEAVAEVSVHTTVYNADSAACTVDSKELQPALTLCKITRRLT